MRLANKVALLSGIGQGMGRATALLFSQEGAKVVLTARGHEKLKETSDQIRAAGGTAMIIPGDLSVKSQVDDLVKRVLDEYGRIDVVYSAAGGNFDPQRKLSDVDENFWNSTISNTMNSLYNLAQSVRPIMKEQGGGSIVTVAASFNVRQEGNVAYGAAKGGTIALSQNLAREFQADNIRVNTIGAGLFRGLREGDRIRPVPGTLARTGYPQDIAYAALFFACDESAWITGQTLSVDGGVDVGTRSLWEHES